MMPKEKAVIPILTSQRRWFFKEPAWLGLVALYLFSPAFGAHLMASGLPAPLSFSGNSGLNAILVAENVSCSGQEDGTAQVYPYGGQPPYSYSWSHDSNADSSFVSGLSVGPVSVTVTDATGDSLVKTAVVKVFEELVLSLVSTPVSCLSNEDGTIEAQLTGGTSPYQYVWSNGMVGAVLDSLVPGVYLVTATDVNGCFLVDSVTVGLASGLDFALALQPVDCSNSVGGSATVTVTGGIAPFTFFWDGFPAIDGPYLDQLSAGTYAVTVTDSLGCLLSQEFSIQTGPGLAVSLSGTAPSCDVCMDGILVAASIGGATPLEYEWNTGATDSLITGLGPGLYCVTVTDGLGCTGTACTLYFPENPLQADLAITDEGCLGASDGTASLILSEGLPPYSIQWSLPGETGLAVDSLSPGNYFVVVSDLAGDTLVLAFEILPGAFLTLEAEVDNAICGNSAGSIDLTVQGGTPPYTYEWSDPGIGNEEDPSGLPSGNYSVTVTDQSGCTATLETMVGDDGVLEISGSVTGNACTDSATAVLAISISGGSGIYSANWTPDQYDGLFTLTGLSAGTYAVTVTDNFTGCTNSASFDVLLFSNPVLEATLQQLDCTGGTLGSIDLTISGGSGNYDLDWDNDIYDGEEDLGDLSVGAYCVTVTDLESTCQTSGCFEIVQTEPLFVELLASPVSCNGALGGILQVSIPGGSGSFVFDWDIDLYDGQDSLTGLETGIYCVTVTDQVTGCQQAVCGEIVEIDSLSMTGLVADHSCGNTEGGSIQLEVSGGSGLFSLDWSVDDYDGMDSLTKLDPGIYCVTVTDLSDGCSIQACYNVESADTLTILADIGGESCQGQNPGYLFVSVQEGTGGYWYDWNLDIYDGQDSLSGLSAGVYCVTVTDTLSGCIADACFEVPAADSILLDATVYPLNCDGSQFGSIFLEVSGGTGPFTYDWDSDTFDGQDSLQHLLAGTYCVTVTDVFDGCTRSACYEVGEENPLVLEAIVENASCDGVELGSIFVEVTSGSGSFLFDWDNDIYDGLESLSDLSAGTYCLSVTDTLSGCMVASCFEIGIDVPQKVTSTIVDVDCGSVFLGSIILEVEGGVGPFAYDWEPDTFDGQDSLTNLTVGSYCVTITDLGNGCTSSGCYEVEEANPLILDAQVQDVSCDGSDAGAVFTSIVGGSGSYLYDWDSDFFDGLDTLTGLDVGIYCITVTDTLTACKVDSCLSVQEEELLELSAKVVAVPCDDSLGGAIFLTISNGIGPYEIEWDDPLFSGMDSLVGLPAGTYCVTVFDLTTGCRAAACYDVVDALPPTISGVVVPVSCDAAIGGRIFLTLSGGSGSYTIDWDNDLFDGQDSLFQLQAGSYSVTVTDDSTACFSIEEFMVGLDSFPETVITITGEGCVPDSNGSIALFVLGGSGNFSYQWVPSVSDTAIATGLDTGLYQVTIIDLVTGCLATQAISVLPANTFEVSAQVAPVHCADGLPGSIDLTITGTNDSAVYLIDWSEDQFDGQEDLDSLPAGSYGVTITDPFGCVFSDTFIVETDNNLEVDAEVTGDSCTAGEDGSINLTILSGTPPYQITWSDPVYDGILFLENLAAGTYQVTITDINGCFSELTYVVENLGNLETEVTIQDNLCGSDSLGSIDVFVTGGTSPYQYFWAHDSLITGSVAQGLTGGNYFLTITDAGGCFVVENWVINENTPLMVMGDITNTPCSADAAGSILLSVKGGVPPYEFQWGQGDTTLFIGGLAPGQYSVTVTDSVGCVAAAIFEVDADGLSPEVTIVTEIIGCSPESAELTFNAEVSDSQAIQSWQWVINGVDTFFTPTVVYTVFGNFNLSVELTVVGENGCVSTEIITVPIELIDLEFDDLVICAGDSVYLNPTGDSSYFYSWFPGELFDDPHILNPLVSPDSTTNFQVLVSHITGGDTCQVVYIFDVIVVQPQIVNLPADTVSCTDKITLQGSGEQVYFFAWFNELGQIIAFGETVTIMPEDSAYYIFSGVDTNSCFASDTILVIDGQPDLSLPDTHVLCVGNQVALMVQNSDTSDQYQFDWQPDTLLLFFDSLEHPVFVGEAIGDQVFVVEAINQYGCSWTDSTAVFVLDSSSTGEFLSFGQCEELTMTFINANAPFYKLCFGVGDSCTTAVSSTFTYPDTGAYTVLLIKTDSTIGCTEDTIAVGIKVYPPPFFDPGYLVSYSTCGDSVSLVFQDVSTHVNDDIVQRQWVFVSQQSGDTLVTSDNSQIEFTLTESDSLYVTLALTTAIGCEFTYRDTLPVDLIEVSLPDSVFICPGDTAQLILQAGFDDYHYSWSPSIFISNDTVQSPLVFPGETTIYTVEITDFTPDTCRVEREVVVVVYPGITLTTSGDVIQCADTLVPLAANTAGGSTLFEWSSDPLFGVVLGTGAGYLAEPGRPGVYYVQATDTLTGCREVDTLEVSNFDVGLSLVGDSLICLYESTFLTAVNTVPSDSFALSYTWSSSDPSFPGSVDPQVEVSPTRSSWYVVTAANAYCEATDSILILVDTFELTAALFLDRDTLYDGQFAILEATALGNALSYSWVPRVGLSHPDESLTEAQPEETTSYTVLITNEATGCTVELDTLIHVLDFVCGRPNIFLPNAFTPNGDNVNDQLYLRGVNVTSMYLAVYNRWGQLVFESAELERGWDGYLGGKEVSSGVYGYYFEVTCGNGDTYFERGNVTVIR